jgi:hypothetical protein
MLTWVRQRHAHLSPCTVRRQRSLLVLVTLLGWPGVTSAQIKIPSQVHPDVIPPFPGISVPHGDGGVDTDGAFGFLLTALLVVAAIWLALSAIVFVIVAIYDRIKQTRDCHNKERDRIALAQRSAQEAAWRRERAPFTQWYVMRKLPKRQFSKKEGPFSIEELRSVPVTAGMKIRSVDGKWCDWDYAEITYPELVVTGIIGQRQPLSSSLSPSANMQETQ